MNIDIERFREITNDVDGLAEYIEKLVKSEYDDDGHEHGFYYGYVKGFTDGYYYRIKEEN